MVMRLSHTWFKYLACRNIIGCCHHRPGVYFESYACMFGKHGASHKYRKDRARAILRGNLRFFVSEAPPHKPLFRNRRAHSISSRKLIRLPSDQQFPALFLAPK